MKIEPPFPRRFYASPIPNFEKFDPCRGIEGYCAAIRKFLMPDSTPNSFSFAEFEIVSRTYCKGSIFSRVRRLSDKKLDQLLSTPLKVDDFFPPTSNAGHVRAGRFNAEGERKLYLADHPFVALKECGIKPGDYFLFSYFTLNKDTHFTYAANDGSRFSQVLSSLFATQDERFYEVIRRVYNDYCNYKAHHGIAYDSVKVQRNQQDATWGTIDSVTNFAMTEDEFPAARLHAGWLARCDEHYRPCYEQMLLPIARKKRQLHCVPYFGNESIFLSAHQKVMKKIQQIRKKTESLIQREDYEDINTAPFKLLPQQGYI
ncbi:MULTISPECIES: hypothetical protein [Pseudomonas fluorescens group]|uniref:RES domain-containing protein n=1 Tax=Pseudomonas fluorescens TaxID=294 RepID=A0AAE2PV54_PSEFL|nr:MULTISPECIES: hypothetical protein [Pseudomonas fluorescens group]MBD8269042.1 hypothetical protein [Pseudomonas fluorescens]UOB26331.1 hypothetical protein MRY17_11700 [Pseudomonas orientalis]